MSEVSEAYRNGRIDGINDTKEALKKKLEEHKDVIGLTKYIAILAAIEGLEV